MESIRWFEELGRNEIAAAGGKGANLGEMVRAGLPVPPGFVLLTPAYREFVAAAGLQPEIERIAGAVTAGAPVAAERASDQIRPLFDRADLPAAVADAVTRAYGQLGRGRVAVRSSATAEDLPGASFAGQQETYLNIEGEEQLLEAVKRCWSSLWTARAIAYRARQAIAPADVALAVVIQRQVEAETAGILFTANPVNGRRDQMVIDSAWGLGEAVVSGQVTPDHWVADGATGTVIEEQIAAKLVMTARQDGRTVTAQVAAEQQQQPTLDAATVAELVAIARQVADHFGSPQDIEWARSGGRFYLVQSRPITSLFPLPEPLPGLAEPGLRAYICLNTLQGLMEPLTPLGISFFLALSQGAAKLTGARLSPGVPAPALKVAAGRLYGDTTNALHHRLMRRFILYAPEVADKPLAQALRHLAERPEFGVAPAQRSPLRPGARVALGTVARVLRALVAPAVARRRTLAIADRYYDRLQAEAARLTGVAERVEWVEKQALAMMPVLFPRFVALVAAGAGASRAIAETKLQAWLGDGDAIQPVLRSLSHNPTTMMDLDLWRLSRRLKAEGAAVSVDHPGVAEFLAQYGHRTVREIDVGMPRWSEEPDHVLNLLRTYLTHDESADAEAHFRRGVEEAEAAVDTLVERVRRTKGFLRSRIMRFLLSRVRALAGMREYPKFYVVKFMALHRRVLLAAGAELVAAGRLERAEDVSYLTLADLTAPATVDLLAKAAANRAEYRRELERKAIPRVMTSTGEAFYSAPVRGVAGAAGPGGTHGIPAASQGALNVPEGALIGTPASPGVYEGRVRVIYDPRGAELQPGEILVAPGTDPAWTPLFLTAGALVMEIGGIMSHGSVVAREYGIPAVVGIPGAIGQLRTGQRVRVDGQSGVVTVLEDA